MEDSKMKLYKILEADVSGRLKTTLQGGWS
jgi:hypothetical protein